MGPGLLSENKRLPTTRSRSLDVHMSFVHRICWHQDIRERTSIGGPSTATSPSDHLIPELPVIPKHLIGFVKLLRFYRIRLHHNWDDRWKTAADRKGVGEWRKRGSRRKQCRWETLHTHPKYEQWLRRTLFHRSASDATTCSEDSTATKKKNGKKVADDFNFSTTPKSV